MTLIILFLKNYKKKKDHFKNPVSLPNQSEAFGWLLAWSEPRNAIFYDFRIGESWPDVFLERFDKQKHWMVHINLKILKKKESLSRGMLSSHGYLKNSEWRRAASHRDGGDDNVGNSSSWLSRETGGSALQNGQVGQRCFSRWLWNHLNRQSWCILWLQHNVLSAIWQLFAQMTHSSSLVT